MRKFCQGLLEPGKQERGAQNYKAWRPLVLRCLHNRVLTNPSNIKNTYTPEIRTLACFCHSAQGFSFSRLPNKGWPVYPQYQWLRHWTRCSPVNRVRDCSSRALASAEMKYTTTEKKCLAIIWAVQKIHHFLLGTLFNWKKSTSS